MKGKWAVPVIASILILGTLGNAYALNPVYLGENIVQTGDMIAGETLTGVGNPHIADNGDVIFIGDFSGGTGIFLLPGGDPLSASLLAETSGAIFTISDLSINDNGDIVFVGGTFGSTAILTETSVIVEVLIDGSVVFCLEPMCVDSVRLTTVRSPSITNNGDVIFIGDFSGGTGIFLVEPGSPPTNSLLVKTGDTIGGLTLSNIQPPSMNNDKDVVFYGKLDGNQAIILIPSDSVPSVIAKVNDIIPPCFTLSTFGFAFVDERPSINDNDEVVFAARSMDAHDCIGVEVLGLAIFSPTQLLVKTQTPIDGKFPSQFRELAINNDGDLLFFATIGGGDGIFTPTNLIAATDDRIDGLTLSGVGLNSMNNNGDVVFVGTGSDPGIYLASIPETSTLTCGAGTMQVEDECEADVTQAQLDDALDERDVALDKLLNLFTNNSCDLTAETIPQVLVCITDLIADLAAALVTIAELEALLGEEDSFTQEECDKFQEIANKRTANGKEVPKGLQQNLDTCA